MWIAQRSEERQFVSNQFQSVVHRLRAAITEINLSHNHRTGYFSTDVCLLLWFLFFQASFVNSVMGTGVV